MLGTATEERERESGMVAGKQTERYGIERWAGGQADPHPVGMSLSISGQHKRRSQSLSCVPSLQVRVNPSTLPLG